jgi:hypothetical protein
MTLCGSFSFVSWTTPFVLAKASALNYITPVQHVLAGYVIFLLITWFAMFGAMSAIVQAQAYARRALETSARPALERRLMDNITYRDVTIMMVIGSVSLFAWIMVFVLAKASESHAMPPVLNIVELYGICLLAVAFVMFVLLRGEAKVRAFLHAAAVLTLRPNAPWEMPAQAYVKVRR